MPALLVRYLTSIFHATYSPESIGMTKSREMRTLAEALDHLCEGRLPSLGDTLMQRFQALEQSIVDGNWHQAKHMEIIPDTTLGLASRGLRAEAAREETRELKQRDLVDRRKGRKASRNS